MGLPILFVNLAYDCVLYIKHLYNEDIKRRRKATRPPQLLRAETYN